MAEEASGSAGGTEYKQVLPSGLAAELASVDVGCVCDPAILGPWLKERLDAAGVPPARLAGLSGVSSVDMTHLLGGQATFPMDTDHLQRFATALIELNVITDPTQLWEAAGLGESDYILPPDQVVQGMSGTV